MSTRSASEQGSASSPPTLDELLAGPLHFVQFAKQFSPVCPKHELQVILQCCEQAIVRWRVCHEQPEKDCCLSAIRLYAASEASARVFAPIQEDKLEPCCQAALVQQRWWKELENKGRVTLGAGHRYQLIISLYNHAMEPKRDRRSLVRATDDLLGALAFDYEAADGSVNISGQNHGPLTAPFAEFLALIWDRLPLLVDGVPHKPNSAKEFVSRARKLLTGAVGWGPVDEGEHVDRKNERRIWDRTHRLSLLVTGPKNLDPALRERLLIHGRSIGETISVPANWDFDERQYLPIAQVWRNRLRDGDVKILKAPPKHLKKPKKRMSTAKGANRP